MQSEAVMDHVVDAQGAPHTGLPFVLPVSFDTIDNNNNTQLKLYSTSWLQSLEALFYILGIGNLVFKYHFVCWDGSWVHRLKATWSGKLSDSYTASVYVYYKIERRNCRCYGTSNQAVIQRFSRTLLGVDLNFQRPGFVFQDRTIDCLLNVASGW